MEPSLGAPGSAPHSPTPPSPEPDRSQSGTPLTPVTDQVVIVEPRQSLDSGERLPTILSPLKPSTPTTPTLHTGLPIGKSRSLLGRDRSDSTASASGLSAPPSPSPTPTPGRQRPLPGGATTLVIPSPQNRISVSSSVSATPTSPTSPSGTHIGNVLAPASFFRPSRPNQQNPATSSTRSIPHSIGPSAPASSHRSSMSIHTSPTRKNVIPDSAIPLASFAARRSSMHSTRMSRSSTLSEHLVPPDESHEGDLAGEPGLQPRPMASREPLLTPIEQNRAQRLQQERPRSPNRTPQSPVSIAMRGSLDRIFRRSSSGDSLSKGRINVPLQPQLSTVSDHSPTKERKQPRYSAPPPITLSVVHPPWMRPLGKNRATGRLALNHELHSGQNRFLFRGHATLGGDPPYAFLGTLTVYCIFVGFWMGTTCVWWWHNLSPALAGVGVYMCLLTLSSLLASAFRDPGILPRDLDLDAPLPLTSEGDSASAVPLPREIRVRDDVVRTKYCVTCRTYRPPRASHCRTCDNCVDGCDHHCPWINNCVGRRNYGSFITCLVCAEISLLLILATAAVHLVVLSQREHLGFAATLKHGFGSAVCFAAAAILIWPVGTLMLYHVRLLVLNTTTIEQVRKKAHKSLGAGAGDAPTNPFTYGSWTYNVAYLLCRPVGYSWLEPDAVALDDKREPPPVDDDLDDRWSRSEAHMV